MPLELTFFLKLTLGHFRRHRLEGLLCLAGIALGVAVVIAIDAAVGASIGSFRGAVNSLAERSTHSIFAREGKLTDAQYIALRDRGMPIGMAPIIDRGILLERAAGSPPATQISDGDNRSSVSSLAVASSASPGAPTTSADADRIVARLIGVDAFSERSLRSFTAMQTSLDKTAFRKFMTEPGQVTVVDELAHRLGVHVGDDLWLAAGSQRTRVHIVGVVTLEGVAGTQLPDLVIADLATAQELTGALGTLDRIDVRLETPAEQKTLEAALPPQLVLQSTSTRADSLSQLIGAYRLNLNALSLLASFVAVFIVYNSLLISVQQRVTSLGILRCLGSSRAHLAGVYLLEAILLAIVGGVLGVLAGWALSRLLVGAIATTINDLYAAVRPAAAPLTPMMFAKGLSLSLFSSLLGAAFPLWRASRTPPVGAFQQTASARSSRAAAVWLLAGSGILFLLGWIAYALPGGGPIAGFVMAFLVAMGFALACPMLTRLASGIAQRIGQRQQRLSMQMAAGGVARSLGITGVAVAAMMLAMSMNIGVRTMVRSFRGALSTWVGQRFAADVFVAPELLVNHKIDATLDPAVVRWIERQPQVKEALPYRVTTIDLAGKPTALAATDVKALIREHSLPLKTTLDLSSFAPADDCLISEPLAGRMKLGLGDSVSLKTPDGRQRTFKVLGVYYDFGSERGQMMIDRRIYQSAFGDDAITSLHVSLRSGDPARVAGEWMAALHPNYPVVVNSFGQVRDEIMRVFDRTFKVTDVLSWLAGGVAFCGLAGSLLALAVARRRDYSVLAAAGMSGTQTAAWVVTQGLLLAWVSAALAAVGGTALAYVLANVIQFRSFGWSIPTTPQPRFWVEGFVIATVAAIVAAVYPIYRLQTSPPAGALRRE